MRRALGKDTYDSIVLVGRTSGLFDADRALRLPHGAPRSTAPRRGCWRRCFTRRRRWRSSTRTSTSSTPSSPSSSTAALYYCVAIAQEGKPWHYALAGLVLGLGMACKVTGAGLLAGGGWWRRGCGYGTAVAETSEHGTSGTIGPRSLTKFHVRVQYGAARGSCCSASSPSWPSASPSPTPSRRRSWQPAVVGRPVARLDRGPEAADEAARRRRAFPPSVQWIDRESYLYPLQRDGDLGHGARLRHRRLGGAGLRGLAAAARAATCGTCCRCLRAALLRLHGAPVLALPALLPAAVPGAGRAGRLRAGRADALAPRRWRDAAALPDIERAGYGGRGPGAARWRCWRASRT